MTRIDEIYFNIFKKYIDKNIPLTRLFFCDPPGHTSPSDLYNYGSDSTPEDFYVFFHDQEPVDFELYHPLFDEVIARADDLYDKYFDWNPPLGEYYANIVSRNDIRRIGAIVVSETGENVERICQKYNWKSYYYFFHGWAALDWFRGYNNSYVVDPPSDRVIESSYISPNRIIGGKRNHRILLYYNLIKNNINSARISMPKFCPYEKKSITEISKKFTHLYPDIVDKIDRCNLPWNFPNENGHPMESCRLGLFDECNKTLAYVVTETIFSGKRNHLTEKTFKPICLQMPFVLLSTPNSLEYLRSYGFMTFSDFWSEDYDQEEDDTKRIEKVAKIVSDLDGLSKKELQQIYRSMIPILEHNYNHFYNGNFQNILWTELTNMLKKMKQDFDAC